MNTHTQSPVSGEHSNNAYQLVQAWTAALGGGVFNWRFIHDQDKGKPAIKRRGTLEQIYAEACRWNSNGYGIFATVNEMDGTGYDATGNPIRDQSGDTLAHVARIRAHVVDLDNLSAMENLQRAAHHSIPPSFIVQTSPGKAHVYWVVTRESAPVDLNSYRTTQRKLRQLFDGDRAVIDATRVLRVPGFWHMKGAPHLVTCYASAGYGAPVSAFTVALSVAHVNAPEDHGGRHPLGDPTLAAPSAEWALEGLRTMPVEGMTHPEFISFTAAFKQAAATVLDADTALQEWLKWCDQFGTDSKGRDYNLKHWNSITDTEIGWPSMLRQNVGLNAKFMFSGTTLIDNTGTQTQLDFLDHSTSYTTVGKPVSFEVYRVLNDVQLPVGFDEFKQKFSVTSRLPWEKKPAPHYPRDWTDTDDEYLRAYMQPQQGMARIAMDQVLGGLRMYADRNRFNPVVDYLNCLQWDGTPRLDDLFTQYFNAENVEFAELIGPKFLIGMVARAMDPGCKRDEMPILEGAQGAKKSSALNILAGDEYFSDGLPNINDKDAMQHLQGMWLIEIGELSALRKSEVEEVKRFVSSKSDKFRPAYGRGTVESRRTSVFAGTTNSDTYLKDPTGARRFWPIRCGSIDLDGLRRDRDQLFAEAVARYRAGERWWLDGDAELALAADETDARQEQDAWHDQVVQFAAMWAGFGAPVTMQAIMTHCLGITNPNMQDRRTTGRIAAILTAAGFRRKRANPDQLGRRSWFYEKE